uniref:Four-jointed box kinase 1 n=1 Tax=Takifugu rubripes TaxID=31033 RepID=H2S505_TAKRU
MRVFSANLLAVLFLCALASVFYVWSALESRLERHKRRFAAQTEGFFHPGLSMDLSSKTFRALLAVPLAQKARLGSRPDARNLTGQVASVRSGDYHVNEDNKRSASREGPVKLGSPVEGGIFWSEWLEELFSAGFAEEYSREWQERVRTYRIVKLEPGCGRISNQLATFADGTKACVRYGINVDQLSPESEQWAAVRTRTDALQWSDRAVVSLTKWVANLSGVVTPGPLRQESSGLHPRLQELDNKTTAELLELMQWTDLILFDYLTANFDRLVSNLFSRQWDSRVMERDTNNLLKTPDGDIVFIDNEAGLVHGYRVLDMWEKYHSAVLSSVCVFRRRTAQRVAELHRRGDSRKVLLELYRDSEPLSSQLGFLSDEHAGILQDRIGRLHKHIAHCKGTYGQL